MKLIMLAAGLGTRLRSVTGGRPKHLLEVGGMTLLERHLALAEHLGLEPVVVTRPEFVSEFDGRGAEVLVEESSPDMLATLSHTGRHVKETHVWVGGDILFTDFQPLREVVQAHLAAGSAGSFLYNRSDRFKAKLTLGPVPRVLLTREGAHPFSMPSFGVHAPRMFSYMAEAAPPPGNYLQRSIEQGEPILFREYRAPVFEIDTPADLAAARRHFELAARTS
jgi:GTP:adenosylcobinamide-phosphate guanylyltransferase